MIKNIFNLIFLMILFVGLNSHAQQLSYQGRIVDTATNLGISGPVTFRVQVRTPPTAGDNCVMYEEQINANLFNGVYVITLNSPAAVRLDGTGYTAAQIFSNKNTFGAFNLPAGNCNLAAPLNWSPGANDGRRVNISFYDANTMAPGTWEPVPTQTLGYVPAAIESLNVGGFAIEQLMRVVGPGGAPFNVSPLNNTQYTELINTLSGNSSFYLDAADPAVGFTGALAGDVTGNQGTTFVARIRNVPVSATAPIAGQVLSLQGGSWTPTTMVSNVTSANNFISIANTSSTPVITLNVGTVANTVAAGDDPRIVNAIGSGATASGDLTGTYPGPTVATVGGRTAAQINTSVGDTIAATSTNTNGTIVKRDGSGNASFTTAQATNFSGRNFYFYDAGANSVQIRATNALASSYVLTLPTTVPVANTVLGTNASGDMSWVNPLAGAVTTVTASAPVVSSGGSTPNISMARATGAADGYLASSDFTTFNNKQTNTLTSGMAWIGSAGNAATEQFLNVSNIKSAVGVPGATNWFAGAACPAGQQLAYSAVTDQVTCTAYTLTAAQVTTALATVLSGDATMNASGDLTIRNGAINNAKISDVMWSKVTSTPTTIAGYGITDAILTEAGGVDTMQAGTFAAMPAFNAPGVPFRFYIATDTREVYYSDGFQWRLVGSAVGSGGTVTNVIGTSPLTVVSGTTIPVISISQANGTTDGYLTSTDWTTFNAKLTPTLTTGNILVGVGNVATSVVPSGDVSSVAGGVFNLANSGVVSGTYTKITVDSKGRAVSGTSLNSSDVTTGLGYSPVNRTGDTMTGALNLPSNGLTVGTNQLVVANGGRVTIGSASGDASALLDITSTSLGFLMPRMTTLQRDSISNPANGLQIYNIQSNTVDYFDGTWKTLASTTGTLVSLNGLGVQNQFFATSTSGNDFTITSASATHTFNIPTASNTNRGLLNSSDFTTFNDKLTSVLTTGNILVGVGNVATSVAPSGDVSAVTGGVFTFANTGVTSGTYGSSSLVPSFSVDSKGRITAAGSQPYDDATAVTKGIVQAGTGLAVASGTLSVLYGNTATTAAAGNDARLSDARTPTGSATGDLTGTYPAPTIANNAITTVKINDLAVTNAKINDVNWGKVTSTPTTIAGYGITDAILTNAGGVNTMQANTLANIPAFNAPGVPFRVYVAHDTQEVYYSDGTQWKLVGSAIGSGGTVTNVIGTSPLSVVSGTTVPVISISRSNATTDGYLASTDFSNFNSKVSSVSVDPPLTLDLTSALNPVIGIGQASTVTDGFLTSGDFSIFNNKLTNVLPTGQIFVGVGNVATAVAVSGDIASATGGVFTLANSGVVSGTYTKITVDSKGRAIAGTSLNSADVTGALGYSPVDRAGDTMIGTLNLPANGITVGTNQLVVANGGRVTIGSASGDASALLDVTSTTLGFLMPRMTTIQRDSISNPADGLQIYNIQTNSIDYWDGGSWLSVASTSGSLSNLNGLTASSQDFTTGSAGTDFNIVSASATHTFNIPNASGANNRGLLTSSDWTTFNNKLSNTLTTDQFWVGVVGIPTAVAPSGDVSSISGGVFVLANTGVVSGTYGAANAVPTFTVDAKGRVTAAGSQAYQDATGVTKGIVQAGTGLDVVSGTLSVLYGNTATTAAAGNDARLSDARVPTGSATGDLTGTYPAPTIANLAVTNAKINDVNWGKVTSTPTTIAGYGITDAILTNAGGVNTMQANTLANIPAFNAPGVPFRVYVAHDTQEVYYSDGTQWKLVGSAIGSGGTVTNVIGTSPLSVVSGTTVPVISISRSNATTDGYLASTDFSNFNGKVSSVSVDPPLTLDLTSALNPVIGIGQASTATDGFLTSGDYSIFNNKLTSVLPTGQIFVGVGNVASAVPVSGDIASATGGVFTLANSGVVSGTYTKITVDSKGRAIAGTSLNSTDVTNGLGYFPVDRTGDTMTGTLNLPANGLTVGTTQLAVSNGGRVTIGSASGDASALLDIASTTLGFLMPRMTAIQRDNIVAPANGLQIYNTQSDTIEYWDGTQWLTLASTVGSIGNLNGLTAPTQNFATGTAGTDFTINSVSATHTFNIPTASAANNRGLLTSSDFTTFNEKLTSVLTTGNIFVGVGNVATSVVPSGDISSVTGGVFTLATTGVAAGNYSSVTVDTKGRVTAGAVSQDLSFVTGTLGVANGGTGANTLTSGSLVVGNGTGAVNFLTAGTAGNVIYGSGASSWASGTPDTAGLVDKSTTQLISGDKSFKTSVTINEGKAVRFADAATDNYVSIRSPAVVSSDYTLTLPSNGGNANQVLQTDGNGTLNWTDILTTTLTTGNIYVGVGNVATSVTPSGDISSITGGVFTLANTGVTSGTYTKVSVDAKGRVTTGANLNSSDISSAIGYDPVQSIGFDAPLSVDSFDPKNPVISIGQASALADGFLTSTDYTFFTNKLTSVLPTGEIFVGVGNVATAVPVSGDIASAAGGVFVLANSGVNAGTYSSVTVDAKGRVTSGAVSQDLSFVTGTLGVANGGTGANTLTSGSLVVGNGTGAVNFLTAGTAGNVIYGSGASSWASGTPDTAGLVDKSTTQLISGDKSFKTNVTINEGKAVRFADAATDNFVSIRSPAVVSSDYTLTLPSNGGNANQVLQTDGNGTLNWADILTTTLTTGNIYVGVGNVATSVTPSGDISSITGGVFTLANTGVTSGTYTKVSVDAKGRVTTGANLNSSDISAAIGYDPVQSIGFDAPLSVDSFDPKNPVISIGQASALADGFLTSTDYTFFTNKLTSVLPTGEIFVGVGNVATAVPVSGDIASAAGGVFVLANSGVNAGTYSRVTVDSKGRVTSGAVSQDLSFVTGTLGVANGGTGANTLTSGSLVVGNGTGAVNFLTAGTAGNVIYGSGASSWASGTPDAAGLVDKSTTQLISGDKSFKTSVTINEGKSVRFADAATDNYISIRSPAVVSSDYTLTLPSNGGNANQVLQTDGSGTLNWADILTTTLTTGNIYVGVGNVATSVTPSGDISSVTGGVFTLANTGVVSGTYTKVSVDAKGRVTTGSSLISTDVTTALGYTPVQTIDFEAPLSVDSSDPRNPLITIGQATLTTDGFLTSSDYTTFTNKLTSVLPTGEIFVGVGNVATAVPVSGDIASAAGGVFVLANSGVNAGTYSRVTVDSKGRVTSGAVSQDLSFVTGTLGVANGGTGANTLTSGSLVVGNGTGAVNFLTAGTAGNVIYGSGASSWASGTPDTAGLVDKSTTQLISGDKSFKTNVTINEGKAVRFADAATDNYVSIRSPAVVSSDYTLTLPSNGGNANQVLQTDGNGTLNWADILTTTLTTGNIYVGVGNVATSVTPSGDISSVTGGVFSLSNTGVVSGTYTKVSVDAKGRVTTGSSLISTDVTTALGYSPVQTIDFEAPLSVDSSDPRNPLITIGQATLTTDGFLTSSDYTTFTNKLTSVLPTGEIFVGVGNVATAVPVSGDIASAANGVFVLANSGVNAGTYSRVTVDSKGRVTSGAVSQDLSFVTGTLGVANGGTGANTLTSGSLVVGNGTGAVNFLTAGTAGNVIYGSGASSWASGTPDTAGLVDKSTTQLISGDKSFKTSVTINEGKSVRFADAATDNYISIRSPAVVSSDYTITLPSNGGNANQVLQTDGSGTLSWADALTATLTTGNIYVGVGNVATSVTPSGDISSITGGVFTLANTGVVSGTYTKISVDAKGRVTTGSSLASADVTTALGYTPVQTIDFEAPLSVDSSDPRNPLITIGQSSSLTDGFLTSSDFTTFTNKLTNVLPTGEIFVGVGNVATAVPVSGDIASAAGGVFVLANSGVNAGTYSRVTVDSKGRVTSGAVSQDLSFVTGTLGVANGGTGANTLTSGSLVVGNGTGAVNFLTAGTAGNVIYGSGASSWASGTPDTAGLVDKSTTQLISGDKSFKTSVTINEGKSVRFADAATDNYVSIRSPAVVSSDYTLTLPSNGGNANQVLQTDGSGTLSWADALTATLTTGNIYVGVGNVATSVAPSGDISSVTGGVFTLSNTGVASGTYTKVSVDAKGRVTTGSSLISTDVTTALGYTPVQTIDFEAPLSVDSSDPRNPLITIGQASSLTDGFLTSSDYTSFTNKLTNVLPTGEIFVGVGNVATAVPVSGDIASAAGGVFVLANSGVSAGTYSRVTVDSKGRVTSGAVSQDLSFVTGTLGVANGGTGATSIGSGNIVIGGGTGAVTSLAAGTAGNVVYATGVATWASGSADTAGLVDKSSTQLISGDKAFKATVTINEGKAIRLADAATDNYISIRSPAAVSSDYTFTLPSNGGNANQVLQTDGSGTLSWADALTATLTTGNFYVGVGNVATSVAPSGDITSIAGGVFTLANTGVASGTYTKVSVDAKGRVTTGSSLISADVTTALGYVPVQTIGFDAPMSVDSADPKNPVISIGQATLTTDGFITSSDYTSFTNKLTSVLPTGEILVGVGNVATPVPVSGDIASAANGVFVLANSGVGAGTYSRVTVDAKGRVTSGAVSQDLSFVTGTLGVANGGTGANTLTSGSLVVGNGTGAVNFLTAGTAGNVIYGSGASSWASGTPDTAGLVDKSTTQLISGDKSFKTSVTINEAKSLRLGDADTSNFVSIRSPAVVSSDYTLTLPTNGGNANQFLQTNGAGTLSWGDALSATLTTGNIFVGVGNVATSVTPSGDVSSVTGGVFTLSNTGVASGTYSRVQVDTKGRVTSGSVSQDLTFVTGTLGVANGGTGITSGTSGGIPYFSAAGTIASSGALTSNGVVLGGGAGATPTTTAAGGASTILRVPAGGGAPSFGSIDLSVASNVSGTLQVANGGTGAATAAANTFFMGPASGAAAAPSFRTITSSDISGSAYVLNGNSFGATATIGTNDLFNFVIETNNVARVTVASTGDVNVGTAAGSLGAAPTVATKLQVNGQAFSRVQTSTTDTTLSWDANNGNVMVWTPTTTATTANITNLEPGGTYMLVIKNSGTSSVNISCNGNGTGSTAFIPANGSRVNGTLNKTVYTLMWDGTDCMVTWITGY